MTDWKATLHLLRGWAGSWAKLSNILGVAEKTLKHEANAEDGRLSDELKQRVYDLRERWEDEHTRSAEMYSLVPRILVHLKSARDAKRWAKVDALIERLEAILDTKDPLVCDS